MKLTLVLAACTAVVSFGSTSARADDIVFTLDTPAVSVAPGSTVSFTGQFSETGNSTNLLYFNGDSYNVDGPLTLDDSGYFNTAPDVLSPGSLFASTLFSVSLPMDIANGLYDGFFTVQYTDGNGEEIDRTATFQVDAVAATPEPGSWALLSTGLTGLAMLRRRLSWGSRSA